MLRSILLLFVGFFSFQAFAYDGIVVKSLWREVNETAGKQYLAILGQDEYTGGDSILIFGEENGKLRARDFTFDGTSLWSYWSHKENVLSDHFYKVVLKEKNGVLNVHMKGKKSGYDADLTYRQISKKGEPLRLLHEAAEKVYSEFERIDSIVDPESLSEFKKMFDLMRRRTGWENFTSEHFPLRTYNLQLEAFFKTTDPDEELARVEIRPEGKDKISKKFRRNFRWYEETEIPTQDEWAEYQSEEGDIPLLPTYRSRSRGFTKKPFDNGAEKFIRYEIAHHTGFPCEDFWVDYEIYTWIFNDGSTLTYEPALECD